MRLFTLLAFVGTVFSTFAFGNGWECEGKDSNYEVRIYNKVSTPATKSPATLLVTRNGEFVAIAHGDQIEMETEESTFTGPKTPSGQMKVYTVKKFSEVGEALKELKGLVVKVNGNPDAEKLAYNQARSAEISLDSARGVDEKLSCYYYLKGKRQELKAKAE